MNEKKYLVVTTYTVQSYGEEYDTIEEAQKEMMEEMKKYTAPNYSFQIMQINYENCTAEMWHGTEYKVTDNPFKE